MVKILEENCANESLDFCDYDEISLQDMINVQDIIGMLISAGIIPDEPYMCAKIKATINESIKARKNRRYHR